MKKPFKLKGILIGYLQNVIAGNNLYMILVPNPPKNYTNQHCKSVRLMPYRLLLAELISKFQMWGNVTLIFFLFHFFFQKNLQVKYYYKTFFIRNFCKTFTFLPSTIFLFQNHYVDLIPYAAHQFLRDDNSVTCIKKHHKALK